MHDVDPKTNEVTTAVYGCARCGATHDSLVFKPFTNPIELGGHTLTHYAACPENDQPILLRIVPGGE